MSNLNNCCKDCKERHYKCHSECERYKEFRKQLDEKNEQMRKIKEEYVFAYQLASSNMRKAEKRAKNK